MFLTIIAASVLGSVTPPDYRDVYYFDTDNWSGVFRVSYWEDYDRFRYKIRLDDDSLYALTYSEVFGSFAHDCDINPGEWETFTIFGNGFGYQETYGYLFSDYDGNFHNFNTIAPANIPGPASLSILGGMLFTLRRRRK